RRHTRFSRDWSSDVCSSDLKILEGTVCNVPPQGGRKHPNQDYVQINTGNILFICGGAFVGLDKIIERRQGRNRLGFTASADERRSEERRVGKECRCRWSPRV